MTTKTKEAIATILRDNIYYSGQVNALVIHEAIEKLADRERSEAIAFLEWIGEEGWIRMNSRPTRYRLTGWVPKTATREELYGLFQLRENQ